MPRTVGKTLRNSLWLLLILSLSGLLTACSGENVVITKKPLRVEYTIWEGDYSLLIAKEKGFFEKHGIQVEPVYYGNFAESLPDMAAGKIDGGLFGMVDVLNVASLIDAKAVAIYDSGGVTSVVATPDIRSPQGLEGKRIGVAFGSSGEMIIRNVLSQAGLTLKDVTLINLPVSEIPGQMPDNIQAGVTYEPYTSQAVQNGNVQLVSSEISSLLPDMIFFRGDVVQQRPDDIRAFLAAWFEAVEFRLANPEESKQIISKITGVPENEIITGDVKLMTLKDNQLFFTDDPNNAQASIYSIARINMDFLVSTGSLTTMMDVKRLFDPSFLPNEATSMLSTAMLGR